MSAFSDFPRASFGGIEFPWEERTVRGAIRHHEHKYPHTPGASTETLGRELYLIDFKSNFTQNLKKYSPDLYPADLARLRRKFEQEERDDLVVPGLGTLKAVCINWHQIATPRQNLSGEKVDLQFQEDIQDAFLLNNLIGVSSQSLNSVNADFGVNIALAKAQFLHQNDLGFLDSIFEAVNSVLAFVDTAELIGNIVETKILAAASLIYQADRRLKVLDDANFAVLHQSFITLWNAVLTLYKDILRTGGGIQTIVVQKTMSVVELSKSLYKGDGTRATEIMQMNAFENPFAIAPGTRARYYPGSP